MMRVLGFALMGVLAALGAGACSNSSVAPEAAGGLGGNSEAAQAGANGGADDAHSNAGGAGGGASNNDAGRGASAGSTSEGGHVAMASGGGRGGTSGAAGASSGGAAGRAGAQSSGAGGGGAAGSTGSAGGAGQPSDEWLAVWGGSGVDLSSGFAITPNHVVIAAGIFGSPSIDLDPTAGVDVHQHLRPVTSGASPKQDAFVVWLNADGSYRRGCTIPGNPGSLGFLTVAAGPNDSAVLAGPFSGTVDFDPGPGEKPVTALRTGSTFVLSLTSSCELSWVYPLNDAILEDYLIAAKGRPLAADASGNIYLTGVFTQFDFDLGPGSQLQTVPQGYDSFLLKLSSSAGFLWVRRIHGGAPSVVSVSPDGKTIVVGGAFGGTIDLDPTSAEDLHTAQSATDGYAAAFDAEGGFLWGYSHGDSDDAVAHVELNNIVIGAGGTMLLGARNNYYLQHRAANGSALWTWDPSYTVRSAAFAPDGRLLLLGRLYGGDPDPSKPYNPTPPFYGSEYLSVFEPNGTFVSSLAFGGSSVDTTGNQVLLDGGYAYVSGTISESPVSNYSYLPQGAQGGQGNEVSLRPNGTDDAFLFRTKLLAP